MPRKAHRDGLKEMIKKVGSIINFGTCAECYPCRHYNMKVKLNKTKKKGSYWNASGRTIALWYQSQNKRVPKHFKDYIGESYDDFLKQFKAATEHCKIPNV